MARDAAPGNHPLRIFLSSTARDLPEHRKAVAAVIDRLGHAPIRMETFGARADQSLAECRRLAAEADAMIVVVAHRYGWVPTPEDGGDGEKSITWHEVDAAVLAAKPVFRYLCDHKDTSSEHRDDDVRLEAFRQALGRYPCDPFSRPDDLATRVAVTLGDWSRRRARDFKSALQMLDLTGHRLLSETLRASSFFQAPLLRLALKNPAISSADLDPIVERSYLRAAKSALVQHEQRCAAQLSALRGQLSNAKAQEREIRSLVQGLTTERPPQRPVPPSPPSQPSPLMDDYDRDSPSRQQVRQMQFESYLKEVERHRQAEAQYELSLTEHGKRQATIPGERLRLQTAQQTVSQLEFNLSQLTTDCANEQRRLEREIDIARDQDISALLAEMRDRGAQQATDPRTMSQGFLLLLATVLSSAFLSKHMSGHASAALWVDEVADDVSEVAEGTVRRDHQRLGKDCLALFGPLQDGLALGKNTARQIDEILDALPPDELQGFASEAQGMLARVIPAFEVPRSLVSPDEIASAFSTLDQRRVEAGKAIGEVHTFFERFAALRASVQDVETQTALLLKRMREISARCQPWLDDCKFAWTIVSQATKSPVLGADTREFCACLRAEAERRLGESVEQLVVRCESRDFGVRDAEAAREKRIGNFLEQSKALEKRLIELKARAVELDQAGKVLANVPFDQAKAYRKRIKLITGLAVLPVLNVVFALIAGSLLSRYDPAIRSNHPAYVDLGRWSLPWLLWAIGVSILGILVSTFALFWSVEYSKEFVVLVSLSILSYGLSLVLWTLKTVSVRGMEKHRRQNLVEHGHG